MGNTGDDLLKGLYASMSNKDLLSLQAKMSPENNDFPYLAQELRRRNLYNRAMAQAVPQVRAERDKLRPKRSGTPKSPSWPDQRRKRSSAGSSSPPKAPKSRNRSRYPESERVRIHAAETRSEAREDAGAQKDYRSKDQFRRQESEQARIRDAEDRHEARSNAITNKDTPPPPAPPATVSRSSVKPPQQQREMADALNTTLSQSNLASRSQERLLQMLKQRALLKEKAKNKGCITWFILMFILLIIFNIFARR